MRTAWNQKRMLCRPFSRREFLAASATAGAMICLTGAVSAAPNGKKTFTILHTNDLHSSFIGMGPASDYTPFSLNDDNTRGGYARLADLDRGANEALTRIRALSWCLTRATTAWGPHSPPPRAKTGGELQLMSRMGYDATTFGNHDFDLGPDGLGKAIGVAVKAGQIPAVVASNTDFREGRRDAGRSPAPGQGGRDPPLRRDRARRNALRHLRGARQRGAVLHQWRRRASFSDAIETAKEMVKVLRETEKVDVVICSQPRRRGERQGRALQPRAMTCAWPRPCRASTWSSAATATPNCKEAIIVNGRTPVVQTGMQGRNLGELVITLDGGKLTVESYRLHPIDDTIAGDRAIADEIDKLKKTVTAAVFASRGYSIDQPLAVAPRDLPNTFTDIAAGTPLANLVTDAFRKATKADIGFTANGMMRAGLTRGKSGVQTVYDVFAVAPLGAGVVDPTAGSALVTGYFTGQELKHLLEFFLVDNPAHPGEYFPRASGMRFRYDPSRPKFDVVTAIELGDLDRGYHAIDISGKDERLYSLTCPLMLGPIIVAIPKYTKGKLAARAQEQGGSAPQIEGRGPRRRLATTRLTCCRRRARWTRTASPPRRGKAQSGRSRNGRRSWITSAACRSRGRANCPRFRSTSVLQRSGRSKQVDGRIP